MWLSLPLLYLCLLSAWARSSVCVCVYCVYAYAWFVSSSIALSQALPGSFTPLSVSVTVPKALKKELINVAFLDSLGNMSNLQALSALLPTPLPFQRTVEFTEYRNVVLESLGLNAESHKTIHQVQTIWIQEQPFILYGDACHWLYSIQNIVTRGACATNLVTQKIRLLNASTKFVEEISNMLKKDNLHLGLNKKNTKKLQATLDGYIKAVNFTIYFCCFSYY